MASRTQLRLTQLTGSVDDTKAAAAAISETSIQGVLDHLAASIKRIHGGSVFQNQTAGAFSQTIDVTGAITGSQGLNVGGDADFGSTINVTSAAQFQSSVHLSTDAAVLNFGADDDVTLTHVADTGLLLNGASEIQFRDSALTIGSTTDGQLDIQADTELAITAPTVDIDASSEVNISNDLAVGGNITVTGNLNVNGTTTTVDSANLQVEDTVILLGSGSSGEAAAGDRGLIMAIASETNPAMFWDESEDQFAFVRTNAQATDNTITADAYASLKVSALYTENGIALPDSAADHFLFLGADSDDLSANRNLVFRLNDADRELILSGNLTVEGASAINQDVTSDASVTFGDVTANGGVVIDNITIDGQEIDVSSGDLTLDVAGNIALNADGGSVTIEDAASTLFTFAANEIDVASGDLTLDVAGDIILNADGSDIFFDDALNRFGSISMLGVSNMLALSSSAGNSIALMSQAGSIILSNADGSNAGTFDLGTTNEVKLLDATDRVRLILDSAVADGQTILSGTVQLDNGADPAELIFKEAAANGSNTITLDIPASVGTSYTITLPASNGSSGDVLKLADANGNLEFGSATGDLARSAYKVTAQITPADLDFSSSGDVTLLSSAGYAALNITKADANLPEALEVFVNGQLLVSGSDGGADTDYTHKGSTTLKFAFNLEADDIVQIIQR